MRSFKTTLSIIIVIIVIGGLVGESILYKNSQETITITVNDKERITTGSGDSMQSKYMVYTDKGVFENTDVIIFGKYNSSDLQNDLKINHTYKVKVAGWRMPFWSMHQNIIEIKKDEKN